MEYAAIATVVTVVEILKNNGLVVTKRTTPLHVFRASFVLKARRVILRLVDARCDTVPA